MFNSRSRQADSSAKKRFYQKKWFKIIMGIVLVLALVGGVLYWKADKLVSQISNGSLLSSIAHSVPGVKDELRGAEDGRINLAILGMRGADMPGGGTLADSIIVVSILPKENKVSMISVPRDLYVTVPGTNAVSYTHLTLPTNREV